MKYILVYFAILSIVLVGCEKYEDYYFNKYEYSAVYFASPLKLGRTVVVGEGLTMKVGVYIGGLRENPMDQTVEYEIDTSLLATSVYKMLPRKYFTLSNNNTIIVPKGKYQGFVDVVFDSLPFVSDTLTFMKRYALPLRIKSTSLDSILADLGTVVMPISYINTFEGYFFQVGVTKQFTDLVGDTLNKYIKYGDELNFPSCLAIYFYSINSNSVLVKNIGDHGYTANEKYQMKLTVGPDNSVDVSSIPVSPYQVENDGKSTWDPVTRTFTLSYKYIDKGMLHRVRESFIFRNRIRDGINEWRWEGFPGNV